MAIWLRQLFSLANKQKKKEEVTRLFTPLKCILRKAHIYEEDIKMAKRIALQRNIPKKDALHAILARNNEAMLISRDRHFDKLKDIAVTNKPEEII